MGFLISSLEKITACHSNSGTGITKEGKESAQKYKLCRSKGGEFSFELKISILWGWREIKLNQNKF